MRDATAGPCSYVVSAKSTTSPPSALAWASTVAAASGDTSGNAASVRTASG